MTNHRFQQLVTASQSSMRDIWSMNAKHALNEQAVPSYLNPNIFVSKIFWKRIRVIVDQLERRKPHTVLDFGCGVGTLFLFLHELNIPRIIAYDPEEQAIEGARRIASAHQLDNIEILSRLEQLNQLESGSIDAITALDVLEHVDDLTGVLTEFERLLKEGGVVYISGPTENWLYRTARHFGGQHYEKHFHVRNIYDIEAQLKKNFRQKKLADLWPLFTFFHLIQAEKNSSERGPD